MHVGDDVFCAAPDLKTAAMVAMQLNASPIEAKAEKQSLGTVSGEFLRMCTRGNVTRGYVSRSIAACIMGQWTSESRLDPGEALQTMITAGWTLANRAAYLDAGLVLYATVCRISKVSGDEAKLMLTGRSALNDGPCRMTGMVKHRIRVKFRAKGRERLNNLRKAYGVRDYLSKHLSDVEQQTLARAEISAMGEMTEASYQKSEHDVSVFKELEEHEVFTKHETDVVSTIVSQNSVVYGKRVRGLLEHFVVLNLVKNSLRKDDLAYALRNVGAELSGHESEVELNMLAWGTRSFGLSINGWVPYSEASSYATKTGADAVICDDIAVFA
jgi:hypothetical protein